MASLLEDAEEPQDAEEWPVDEVWRPVPGHVGFELSDRCRVRTFWIVTPPPAGTRGLARAIGNNPRIVKPCEVSELGASTILFSEGRRKRKRNLQSLMREIFPEVFFVPPCLAERNARKTPFRLTRKDKDEICYYYESGLSSTVVAEMFGIHYSLVCGTLRALGVPRRSPSEVQRRYDLNESVFDVVTEESAYWIGFLLADGNVSHHTITICLSSRDREHLARFRKFLGASNPIKLAITNKEPHVIRGRQIPVNPAHRISIHSERLAKALSYYGVLPRKSLTAKVIGLENNRDFWRGVVDGDGTLGIYRRTCPDGMVYENHPTIRLVGSHLLMEQFGDFIRTNIDPRKGRLTPSSTIWAVQLAGRFGKSLVDLLYRDCVVALSRKHEIARRIMDAR